MKKSILSLFLVFGLLGLVASTSFAVEGGAEKDRSIPISTKLKVKTIVGTVQSIGSSSLVVKNETGDAFTVNVDSSTRFVRKFGGKIAITEVSVNDKVKVFGRVADGSDGKTVLAKLIWDTSVQKRHNAFWSKVISISESTIVVETCKRDTQTVTVDSATKVKKADGKAGLSADITVGSYGIFSGLWDNKANTLDVRGAEKGKVVLRSKIGCFESAK